MPTSIRPFVSALVLAPAVLFHACGDASPRSPAGTAPPANAPGGASASTAIELTAQRLAAFERGLRKEIEAVHAAQERSAKAATPAERGLAMQESFEHATMPQGAAAAGLDDETYRELRETVFNVFRTLDFQGKIDGPLSLDLSQADAATKERYARDPFADLSTGSAAALRSEMNRLLPVWIEYTTLTAVAG
jgi:hypothetical protein